jgi:hypothetical protein
LERECNEHRNLGSSQCHSPDRRAGSCLISFNLGEQETVKNPHSRHESLHQCRRAIEWVRGVGYTTCDHAGAKKQARPIQYTIRWFRQKWIIRQSGNEGCAGQQHLTSLFPSVASFAISLKEQMRIWQNAGTRIEACYDSLPPSTRQIGSVCCADSEARC